ncbi:glycosyltransferase family 91 protein [Dothistroma septosporum NZE10]|uniref:Glycosyltransferase family 91 protein n=1 Tax=Dothistroma septosporum (strain NZE10 / CBS 128990) TaxID=675120 RepID=N1PBN7_DOTSN|nr:glycosyltransferase family 91 protein [Dothistroma septosporum NZE10]
MAKSDLFRGMRCGPAKALSCIAAVVLLLLWRMQLNPLKVKQPWHSAKAKDTRETTLAGYVNTGRLNITYCDDIRRSADITVHPRFDLEDDIQEIAQSLEHHPRIDYTDQDSSLTHAQQVDKTWLRMAPASVWLDSHGVFLSVTRVFWYDKGNTMWPVINFIRAQVYDSEWNELRGYTIKWQGKELAFPRTFEIPTPYTMGGAFYGPEDPRIVIEPSTSNSIDGGVAEPLIIFNMVANITTVQRAMFIHRPFSNLTTMLYISGQEKPNDSEKNWMPFFLDSPELARNAPSDHVYFVYDIWPLKILKCHLDHGRCDFVFKQEIDDGPERNHEGLGGALRGGTTFVPLKLSDNSQSFVAFPKTHIGDGCNFGFYRPVLLVLTATSPTTFHVEYLSEPLDFGVTNLTYGDKDNVCGPGRILIVTSIPHWDQSPVNDVMTVTFTVDDRTTEVMKLEGIGNHLRQILQEPGSSTSRVTQQIPQEQYLQRSKSGEDVLGCTVEAARALTRDQVAMIKNAHFKDVHLRTNSPTE